MRKIISFLSATTILLSSESLVFDPHFSPYAGASDIRLAHSLLTQSEDHFIHERRATTGAAIGRFFEVSAWDVINALGDVTQHEVFGHGYRLRELGYSPTGYLVAPGFGYTAFEVPDSFSVGNMLAVTVAGLEAEAILANQIKMQWMQKGSIDGRLASMYSKSEQSLFWYTLVTHLGELKGDIASPSNDIDSYVKLLNVTYPDHKTSVGQLTKWAICNWLDPMTFYALFSWFHFVFQGEPWTFPTIHLKENVTYLPNVRIGYAPYGPEAYFENYFAIDGSPLYAYVKGGPRSVGFGCNYPNWWHSDRASLGARIDGWRQRRFTSDLTVEDLEQTPISKQTPKGHIWGAALTLVGQVRISPKLALFSEVGGKTNGYLPGYTLSGGAVVRIGLTFNPEFNPSKVLSQVLEDVDVGEKGGAES